MSTFQNQQVGQSVGFGPQTRTVRSNNFQGNREHNSKLGGIIAKYGHSTMSLFPDESGNFASDIIFVPRYEFERVKGESLWVHITWFRMRGCPPTLMKFTTFVT